MWLWSAPIGQLGIDLPDIFDEVAEDLRADRMRRLLLRYGGLLAAAAAVVVLAVAGMQAWRWYQARQSLEYAQTYVAATKVADATTEQGRSAAGPQLAQLAANGNAGYRSLARLRQAALLADSGDLPGANKLWDALSADGGADTLLRDFATLQWAQHNLDNGDPAELERRLQTLAAPASPWHGLAGEAQALLALRQGKVDAARDTLRLLAQDTGVPEGVRQRASGLLEQIGATAASDPRAAAAPPSPLSTPPSTPPAAPPAASPGTPSGTKAGAP